MSKFLRVMSHPEDNFVKVIRNSTILLAATFIVSGFFIFPSLTSAAATVSPNPASTGQELILTPAENGTMTWIYFDPDSNPSKPLWRCDGTDPTPIAGWCIDETLTSVNPPWAPGTYSAISYSPSFYCNGLDYQTCLKDPDHGAGVEFRFTVIPPRTLDVPLTYPTIQDAVNDAYPGDTINVAAGTYDIASTIVVNKALTISGPASGVAKLQGTNSAAVSIFEITASNVTIQNLEITHNALTPGLPNPWAELPNSLVRIPSGTGLSGIVITNNKIYVPVQSGAMSTWNGVAITVGANTTAGISITGNIIHNTRNGVVVQYNNIATVSNNVIYDTKGGVMNYTNTQADANNRTVSNNTWGTTHNEWDIVWNSGGGPYEPDYNKNVLVLSGANNDAYVISKMTLLSSPATTVTGNRSHIFVNNTIGTATKDWGNGNQNIPFATLALGIEAVVPGGTVNVAAGTYNENQIVIDKNLTIVGADKSTTVIKPNNDTIVPQGGLNPPGDSSGWFVINSGINANISGFTFDGSGKNIGIAILSHGSGSIENNIIENVRYTTYRGFGVYLWNATTKVAGNTFSNIERVGIILKGASTNANITGNNYTGKGVGNWLDYGIELGAGAKADISGNTINNNLGVASVDGSTSAGILVTTYYGGGTQATITGNTISNCTDGVDVGYDENDNSVVTISSNSITNIAEKAVNSTKSQVDATNNWWGTTNSIEVAAKISGPVTYNPWYADARMTNLGVQTTSDGSYASSTLTNENSATTSTSAGTVSVIIPAGVIVTGPATWDGTINMPTVITTAVAPTPDSGNTASVISTIEIGFGDTPLTFDQAVKITFAGQAGKYVGYSRGGIFTPITAVCGNVSNPTLSDGADCKIDSGADLLVWTKHFTTFTTYTQSAIPIAVPATVSVGGGGGLVSYTAPSSQTAPVNQPAPVGQVLGATIFNFTNSLKVGMVSSDVSELQKRLTSEGVYSGPITGYFGQLTSDGVKRYQAKYGISPVGIVGPQTLAKLNSAFAGTPTGQVLGATAFRFTEALSLGSRGDDVSELQTRLTTEGVYSGPVTGYFGPLTQEAVKKYQAKYGIDQAGVVGPLTRSRLNE